MHLQNVADWKIRKEIQIDKGDWCGIAIGPQSDEAVVSIDGTLLQAGRVLPLSRGTTGLTVKKIRPSSTDQDRTAGGPGTIDNTHTIASIATLQLMLFDNPCELAAYCPRANGQYDTGQAGVIINGNGTLADLIIVPFIGRRHAVFSIVSNATGGAFSYEVYGCAGCRPNSLPTRWCFTRRPEWPIRPII